jgi:DNA helicase-2/ATP-dependent DNA helicase PcrA
LKKIKLKRRVETVEKGRIGYKINYFHELNPAQYEAVMHNNGAALVIAGAGTGKTRTLTYRVARLIEDGVPPETILLLTFTRKASAEMLRRASSLLDGRCEKVSGGTFHSFGANILRKYAKLLGYDAAFNILDQSDSEDVINLIRTNSGFTKQKKRFPRKSTLQTMLSLSINTRSPVEEILEKNYPHFIELAEEIKWIFEEYDKYKKRFNLIDYDGLLTNLLELLKNHETIRKEIHSRYKYIMVDEYQDSNRLQHEIVLLLAGEKENVMAVGDDAQSIYAFRGANFQNIMFFPESFSKCEIFKVEENYRSTQPILNVTNEMINSALFKYEKNLFSQKINGEKPKVISARTERHQSMFVVQELLELREMGMELSDIAVLFRSGFHSFDLEIELERANIPYVKFGGMKFMETAHVKDLIAYMRVLSNPRDAVSMQRILLLQDGIGPSTASRIIESLDSGEISFKKLKDFNIPKGKKGVYDLFGTMDELQNSKMGVGDLAGEFARQYKPLMELKYEDWRKRWRDIETFLTIAERYKSLQSFLNDMAIDPPSESLEGLDPETKEEEFLTLSTIHSAKGLEWRAVFIIWALEGRFPSAKAVDDIDSVEEERRLFYVAATRAKEFLYITHPVNIFDRESGFVLSEPSRFIAGISEEMMERYILEEEDEDND